MEENNASTSNNIHTRPLDQSKETKKVLINPKMLSSASKFVDKNENPSGNMYINPDFFNSSKAVSSQALSVNQPSTNPSSHYSKVKPHINPNFRNMSKNNSAGNILDASTSVKRSVHVNPNFVGRRLPSPPISTASCSRMSEQIQKTDQMPNNVESIPASKPHINPKFVDALKTKAYDDAIKQVVKHNDFLNKNVQIPSQDLQTSKSLKLPTSEKKLKVYINPKFTDKNDSFNIKSKEESVSKHTSPAFENISGKENQNSYLRREPLENRCIKSEETKSLSPKITSVKSSSSPTKTMFKKIGTRKIVRMSGASPSKDGSSKNSIASQNSSQLKKPHSVTTPNLAQNKQSEICNRSTGSAFKKIGQRKLIRKASHSSKSFSSSVKKSIASSQKHPSSAQVYRLKTNKKIIKESSTPITSLEENTPIKKLINRRFVFSTPMGKRLKRQKVSSTGRKSKLSQSPIKTSNLKTPVGIFKRKQKTPFSLIRNPFRVDRRKNNLKRRLSMTSIHNQSSGVQCGQSPGTKIKRFKVNSKSINKQITAIHIPSNQKSVTAGNHTNSCVAQKDKFVLPPPKPIRKQINPSQIPKHNANPSASSSNSSTLIQVNGVRYSVSENGRKLKRVPAKEISTEEKADKETKHSDGTTIFKSKESPLFENKKEIENSCSTNVKSVPKKKFYLEGEEYVEDEPGILIRSRNSMTRASITNYKSRSINTILKSQTRAKQYCMFFNKFGKCNKRDKGVCPYIHDPEKVAVCRKFLHGNCYKEVCLLSHKVAPEKMPSCKFFLEGLCTKENCPYRHVKVSENAEICDDYRKGYCPNGSDCKKKHEDSSKVKDNSNVEKSELQNNASISKNSKRIPPVKPKRKSLGPATMKEAMDSTKPQRYYHEETNRSCKESNPSDINYDDSQNNDFKAQSHLYSHESTEKRLNDELNIGENTEEKQEPERFPMNSNSKNILQSPNDNNSKESKECRRIATWHEKPYPSKTVKR